MTDPLRLPFDRFASWMRDDALPFWSTAGLSPEGGVAERMTLTGQPDRAGFKRVRVHARQLYVFAHAHTLGIPGMLDAGRAAYDFLAAHGRHPEGGWVVRMGETGGVVDAERDLYDQAFVILAMAWWGRASGAEAAIATARDTLGFIRRGFARDDGRGFRSRLPDAGEGLQNPHMHLFEAVLALHETAPDAASEAACAQLRAHFDACLFDPDTGTLGEIFDADWRPAPGEQGQRIEPGHHYEWAWLLEVAERAGFGSAEPAACRLFDFAESHGLVPDPKGRPMIRDVVGRQGGVLEASHRSWPHSERLKALAVRAERHGTADRAALAGSLEALWHHYLAPAPRGCWIDHVDASFAPRVSAVPASTLYHLFLAYAELDRCAQTLFGRENTRADRP